MNKLVKGNRSSRRHRIGILMMRQVLLQNMSRREFWMGFIFAMRIFRFQLTMLRQMRFIISIRIGWSFDCVSERLWSNCLLYVPFPLYY